MPTEPPVHWPDRPHPRVVSVWRWRAVLATPLAIMMTSPLLLVVLIPVADRGGPVLATLALAFLIMTGGYLAWAFVYAQLAYDRMRFRFEADSITVQRGVVFRRRIQIPLRRIQDIQVVDGPLLRAHGLRSIKLQTAAQGQTNLAEGQLPGLANAQAVADALMERIKRLRGDV